MRRRLIWAGGVAAVAAAAGISIVARPMRPDWTTSSSEALAEFEAGLEADMKLYGPDAFRHFERAVELDPGFVVAKTQLAEYVGYSNRKRAKRLFEEVAASDLRSLSPRERLIVEYSLARRHGRFRDSEALLDDYLSEHADDFHALGMKAAELFSRGDAIGAEHLYRRLLEIEPNFVLAYGQLGYITMVQTRFAEAEEYFTTYRFIAPEQANPHDSLGELYTIQGRYDEAAMSFENAIRIKPDFWPSYSGLVRARLLQNDFQGAEDAIERFAVLEDAPEYDIGRLRRRVRLADAAAGQRWHEMLGDEAARSFDTGGADLESVALVHLAACRLGDWDLTASIETDVHRALEAARRKGAAGDFGRMWPLSLHLEGVRLAVQGETEEAVGRFSDADANLIFKNSDAGIFKLTNQVLLVEALMARGDDAAAHRQLAKIRAVNPTMVQEFEDSGFRRLGLDR